MQTSLPTSIPRSIATNRLFDVGQVLVMTPVPRIKVLGVAAVAAGPGLELFDEIHRRKFGGVELR